MKQRVFVLLCLVLLSSAAQAMTGAARSYAENWTRIGAGEMRWFGLKVYAAELWVSGARFDPEQVFALQLTYARDFAGSRLAAASVDEMKRVGRFDSALLARWQSELMRVFPDVKEGDQLIGVYLPGHGAAFYHQGKLTGELSDPDLSRRFFNIWLDPRTSEPGLRAKLLGVQE
jgi:hypothetical protein